MRYACEDALQVFRPCYSFLSRWCGHRSPNYATDYTFKNSENYLLIVVVCRLCLQVLNSLLFSISLTMLARTHKQSRPKTTSLPKKMISKFISTHIRQVLRHHRPIFFLHRSSAQRIYADDVAHDNCLGH